MERGRQEQPKHALHNRLMIFSEVTPLCSANTFAVMVSQIFGPIYERSETLHLLRTLIFVWQMA